MFYSLPQSPAMFAELVGMLRPVATSSAEEPHRSAVVLYSQYAAIKLGLVVGSERARKMLKSKTGVHVFC